MSRCKNSQKLESGSQAFARMVKAQAFLSTVRTVLKQSEHVDPLAEDHQKQDFLNPTTSIRFWLSNKNRKQDGIECLIVEGLNAWNVTGKADHAQNRDGIRCKDL